MHVDYKDTAKTDYDMYFLYDSYGYLSVIRKNDTSYYPATNQKGDVVAIYDGYGEVVAKYEYDAWGNILSIKNGNTDLTHSDYSEHIANLNPIRYRGYYYDTDTKLYYLQSRYYNPELGRFLNADNYTDMDNVIGGNVFAYCLNNPVNMSDHSGHFALPFIASFGAVLAETVSIIATAVVAAAIVTVAIVAVAAVADVVKTAVENHVENQTERDNSVYVMRSKDNNNVQYVGRTNNIKRRTDEHRRDKSKDHLKDPEIVFTELTKTEARVVEQVVISAYSLSYLDNARREISRGNLNGFTDSAANIGYLFANQIDNEILCLMEE